MATPKFKPHYNRELRKTYHTAKEYYSDLKKAGLAPYDPSSVSKTKPKPYKESEWARQMKKDIHDRHGRPPGGRFIEELAKRGFTKERMELARRLSEKGEQR